MATARCTWTEVSGVDGYNVYLKSNGTFVKQNSELITETVYDIENLEDGNYEAYATSVLNSVESDASNVKGFDIESSPYIENRFVLIVDTGSSDTFNLRNGQGTDYPIDWYLLSNPSINGSLMGNGAQTITFPDPGIYVVQIGQPFHRLAYFGFGDRLKVIDLAQFGNIQWSSLQGMFQGCENMEGSFTDVPDLSLATNMQDAFLTCQLFNPESLISGWDTSGIESFYRTFMDCAIDQDFSGLDISSVTTMYRCFHRSSGVPGLSCENFTKSIVGIANFVYNNLGPYSITLDRAQGRTFATSNDGGANFANAGTALDYLLGDTGSGNAGWTMTHHTEQENCS